MELIFFFILIYLCASNFIDEKNFYDEIKLVCYIAKGEDMKKLGVW